VQILRVTFNLHPWCSSSNAICQEWLAKDNQNSNTGLDPSTSLGAAISLRSAHTKLAQHKRIATHYCGTHRFDAPVPMHKVSPASTNKRKSHLQPSDPLRAQIKQDSTAKRRRPEPSRARANFPPQRNLRLPEKKVMSRANPNIQMASTMQLPCDLPRMTCKTQSEL